MSSPASTTLGSASRARRSPAFSALARVSVVMPRSRRRRTSPDSRRTRPAARPGARSAWRTPRSKASTSRGGGSARQAARRLPATVAASASRRGEELVVGRAVPAQVGLDPLDRVLQPPVLQLVGQPVLGRVVGGGVGAHPVGVGLDQRRPVARPGPLQGGGGHRVHGEHVVAVHPYAGEAEAGRAPVQRDPRLPLDRLGDRPLVVLAEEHDRGVVGAGEDERLVHVALAGRPVAEVADHRGVPVRVAGADVAVALDPHGVPDGVQGLGADDDRVLVEAGLGRVPGAEVHPAVEGQQPQRVDPAAPGHAVLAVGGERVVLAEHGPAGADLRRLLTQAGRPDAELALPLQGDGLGVDPAGQHHVGEEALDQLVVAGERVLGVLQPLTLGGQQLDELYVPGRIVAHSLCPFVHPQVRPNVPPGRRAGENKLHVLASLRPGWSAPCPVGCGFRRAKEA